MVSLSSKVSPEQRPPWSIEQYAITKLRVKVEPRNTRCVSQKNWSNGSVWALKIPADNRLKAPFWIAVLYLTLHILNLLFYVRKKARQRRMSRERTTTRPRPMAIMLMLTVMTILAWMIMVNLEWLLVLRIVPDVRIRK